MRMTEIKDISKLLWHLFATISILQKFEGMRGCNRSFMIKKGPIIVWMAAVELWINLEKAKEKALKKVFSGTLSPPSSKNK